MGQTGWTPVAAGSGGWTPVVYDKPAAVTDVPRDARGMPGISSHLPEQPEQPTGLAEMLGPLAHPETFTDFARLLTLPVDAVKKAAASALALSAARAAPAAAAQAVTKAPSVVGNAMAATGRGMERVGAAVEKPLGTAGIVDLVTSGNPIRSAAIAAAPKVVQMAGRGLQRAGGALAAERAAVAPLAEEAAEVAPAAARAATIPPTGSGARLPDQKALNEAALAVRRAAYQASLKAEATASPTVGAPTATHFHGTTADAARAISEKGFQASKSGTAGPGVYLSESQDGATYVRNAASAQPDSVVSATVNGRVFDAGVMESKGGPSLYLKPNVYAAMKLEEAAGRAAQIGKWTEHPEEAAQIIRDHGYAGVKWRFADGRNATVVFDPQNVSSVGMSSAQSAAKTATASPAASAAETAATVSKFRLSAPEAKDYIALIKQGKTRQQAMETIEAARAFAKRFGLQTPTYAETTFPKGMRGKVPPSS